MVCQLCDRTGHVASVCGDNVIQEQVTLPEKDDWDRFSCSDSSSDEEWDYHQQMTNLSNGVNKTRTSRNAMNIDSSRASSSVSPLQNDFQPVACPQTPSLVSGSLQEYADTHLFSQSPGARIVRTPPNVSMGQRTRSSFDYSMDFYTPRRDSRVSEPTRAMDDSLSPVSLGGTSDITVRQSHGGLSIPRLYGGRNLRNREQLRRPDYYQARIYCYNEGEVGQDEWV